MRKLCLFTLLSFVSLFLYAQTEDKCTQVLAVLDKTKGVCEQTPATENCNVFVARVVKEIYGIGDFESSASGSGYLSANQIADRLFIELSDKWENLGSCDQQQVLDNAQNIANSNRCVVAVWRNPDDKKHGHVAIILPGKQQGGWNGMKVPNAANFAQDTIANNFVCDKLSKAFAFNKIKQVFIFVKKD
ncbi:hypothetical protein [Flavisolibacter nicotianae]|uniref:hypothetical protein n=1 Tax=Flavisolibacter nicotianae TaxID=2364882 RepID=UPI000EAF1955|nr:hypothetical protein [Flavisolibacter nicotianae]